MSLAFIDSNVIVKYFAGDAVAKKILEPVIHGDITGYVNSIVVSEVIFVLLKLLTNKTAYELKNSPETVRNVAKLLDIQVRFLREYFSEIEINDKVKETAIELMREYGLLPNDALIASTCKHYGINTIFTFDKDFKRIPWLRVIP